MKTISKRRFNNAIKRRLKDDLIIGRYHVEQSKRITGILQETKQIQREHHINTDHIDSDCFFFAFRKSQNKTIYRKKA